MMTSKDIRESFLKFFESKQHHIVPSAPMVIKNDPTLMFTNAGMNQFKDIILGNAPTKYSRVADSQKCLRVSGKQNDLEEVGHDTYHHTMFEMLGNWSFGDYFKKEAIAWAWEFLTQKMRLNPDNLYVTVFEGCKEDKIDRDDEAAKYWENYLPKERILNGSKKDNFWEMGDTGPCGPCSEIHIDLRPDDEKAKVPGRELVNHDDPLVIEIWNLVFMQYDRKADGSLALLPAKVIDTGMGFERLCMAVQNKKSNYDTDIFQTIIRALEQNTNQVYGDNSKIDIAMRVIADHVRTLAFSITDGQLPSNAKAGYVIRRILRRAVRYGYTFLNQRSAFMYKLIPALIDTMGEAYPELTKQKVLVEKVIKEEEESFLRTLDTGIRLLDKKIEEAKQAKQAILNGEDAFILYDTYGFPLDLIELILREHNMSVDIQVFNAEMEKQRDRARNATAVEAGDWVILKQASTEFVGYDFTESDAEILRYREVKQKGKSIYQVVLSRTPFYAEMGGQVGDSGWLIAENGEIVEIADTKNENNLIVHILDKLPKDVTGHFKAKINEIDRTASECNHTATHLLHEALREVLGEHVEQKGSYVSPKVLRFDFAHFQKMTDEEIRQVERIVARRIRENLNLVEMRDVPIAEAKAMNVMALFGEKYGEEVRVIRFGTSVELCGGTHISTTGRIGSIRIVSESSIAAGIRRIEAVTAEECENYNYALQDVLSEIRSLMNTSDIGLAIRKFISENNEMKKQVEAYMKEKTIQIKDEVIRRKEVINGIDVFRLSGPIAAEIVKDIAFQVQGQFPTNSIFVGATDADRKPLLTLMITKDLVEKNSFNAGQIIRDAAKHIQGGGGGQPHFATAGGKNIEGLAAAMNDILDKIKA